MTDIERIKLEAYIASQIIDAFEDITRPEIAFQDLQDIAGGIAHIVALKVEGKK